MIAAAIISAFLGFWLGCTVGMRHGHGAEFSEKIGGYRVSGRWIFLSFVALAAFLSLVVWENQRQSSLKQAKDEKYERVFLELQALQGAVHERDEEVRSLRNDLDYLRR